jgi:cytochrome c oxidase cbb3-type subunit 2
MSTSGVVASLIVAVVAAAAAADRVYAQAAAPAPATVALYRSECSGCHGERGDGNGQADPALSPPPRDFTRGKYKLRTTNPRQPITIDELAETITNGIPGTAMLSFRYLSADERRALAEYVRRFGVPDGVPAATPVTVGDPPPTTPELLAAGRKQYEQLGCPVCHGPDGKGDGPAASALQDEWRNPDPARNLIADEFRGGDTARALYLRMAIGMPGTPMPGYADVADSEGLWALVAYLRSIRKVAPLAADSPRFGAQLFAARHCRACHQLGGLGGSIGPALDQVTERRTPAWLEAFLANPRPEPKVYPELPHRMPQLYLTPGEIAALIAYLGKPNL